jgi:hypothetical protein
MAITDSHDLAPGARVSWNTSKGRTNGVVLRKAICHIEIGDFETNASRDNPVFVVRNEKSGKLAAHKRRALRLLSKPFN